MLLLDYHAVCKSKNLDVTNTVIVNKHYRHEFVIAEYYIVIAD